MNLEVLICLSSPFIRRGFSISKPSLPPAFRHTQSQKVPFSLHLFLFLTTTPSPLLLTANGPWYLAAKKIPERWRLHL